MSKVAPISGTGSSEERRNERRRRVLLFGRLSDLTGAKTVECAISNVSPTGAQVRLYAEHALGERVYLIDAKTHSAHLAAIIWRRGDRLGLHFIETYDLEREIPERIAFLKGLFIETKLRQIALLEAKGFTREEALEAIGATLMLFERWRRVARSSAENVEVLRHLESLPDG